jgi:hypothetical protein
MARLGARASRILATRAGDEYSEDGPCRPSPGVKCTLVAVRREDPDAVATYGGPVSQFLGPMSGREIFGLSAWHFEQLTVIIDGDFSASHA